MKPSHFIHSGLLVALISFLNLGVAQSSEAQPSVKAPASANTSAAKNKSVKTKSAGARTAKTGKTSGSKISSVAAARKPTVIRMASNDVQKYSPPPASVITINPYFVNQPAAILPRAVSASMAALAAATPAVNAAVVTTPAAAPVVEPKPSVSAPVATLSPVAPSPAAPVQSAQKIEPPIAVAAVAATPAAAPQIAVETVPVAKPVAAQTPVAAKAVVTQGVTRPGNPYLANPYFANQPNYAPTDPAKMFSQFGDGLKISSAAFPTFGPGQPNSTKAQPSAAVDSPGTLNKIFTSLKMMVPLTGDSNILPTIKKVYPTGEKPLVVINFKCPTEVIGITPPPMKLLHEALNLGFEGLNKTNLLSFNLQQVCS